MKYNEIINEIKNNEKLVGIKIIYDNKKIDFTIYAKNRIYNINQKNFKDGLIHAINSNIFPNKLNYEPIFDINELHY